MNFLLPFGGKLKASNRWVRLAKMMPWQLIEECYADRLEGTGMGSPAKSGRIAYATLVIKERLGITDEETVEQISENPYLQHFLGLTEFREKALYDPSMMVHFRARFTEAAHQRINDEIIRQASANDSQEEGSCSSDDDDQDNPPANDDPPKGCKLLIDATCAPADITFPTDLKLLGEAREKTERFIDILHAPFVGERSKPRTYRRKARKQYLAVAKQKKPSKRKIRKAIGQQLRYIRRNLGHLDKMLESGSSLTDLSAYQHHADTIYRTRVNRAYCKERGIRLSGKPLGRAPKQTEQNREQLKARKNRCSATNMHAFRWKGNSAMRNEKERWVGSWPS